MKRTVVETVLTGEPAVYVRSHSHGTDTVTGYVVVATSWTSDTITRRDVAVVDGGNRYAEVLDAAHRERARTAGKPAYAVIEFLYGCGCRSDADIIADARAAAAGPDVELSCGHTRPAAAVRPLRVVYCGTCGAYRQDKADSERQEAADRSRVWPRVGQQREDD